MQIKDSHEEDVQACFRDVERHAQQERKRQQRGVGSEGWNTTCVIRKDTLAGLLSTLLSKESESKVLIRAPPGSGKTTMAETFATYCAELGHPVYSLTLLWFDKDKHKDADGYFRSYTYWRASGDLPNVATTFSCIIDRAQNVKDSDKPLILVIDETQIWYNDDMAVFWRAVKDKPAGLKILFFAAFGDARDSAGTGTPSQIGKCARGLDLLRLSLEDAKEVVGKMIDDNERTRARCFQVHPATLEALHDLAAGHAQVIREVVEKFITHFENYSTFEQQVDFLQSHRCFIKIGEARAFLRVEAMKQQVQEIGAGLEFFNTLLDTCKGRKPVLVQNDQLRKTMLMYGLFYQDQQDPMQLCVLCPAAFDVLLGEHLTGTLIPNPTVERFEEFILATIQRINGPRLRGSVSEVADTDEDFLQKEFYRAAATVLLPVSIDTNREQQSYTIQTNAGISLSGKKRDRGKCDFFINSTLRWAIELMCRGNYNVSEHKNRISEHVNRFHPETGRYSTLRSRFKAVLDFHVTDAFDPNVFSTDPRNDMRNQVYWAVVFSSDFATIKVYPPFEQRDGQWNPREVIEFKNGTFFLRNT